MKIAHVLPVPIKQERVDSLLSLFNGVTHPDTKTDVIFYEDGPTDLEYYGDDIKAINLMLKDKERLKEYDALSIACFYDPGIRELKEALNIPVIGIAQASYMLAQTYGHSFSIIVGRQKNIPKMKDNTLLYGLRDKVASWKSLDMTVEELRIYPEKAAEIADQLTKEAIEKDGAEVVILGCGALSGVEVELQKKYGIPVINPVIAGITCAEWLGSLKNKAGLTTSKKYDFESKDILTTSHS